MTFEEFLKEWRSGSDVITAYTSGSTGTPKTIELDKEFVRLSGERTNSFFHIGKGSRLHSCVAADFIGGKMMAVRAEIAGGCLTWETPSNRPLQGIGKEERIDLLAVVPSQMIHILEHLEDMPKIGAILVGGSAINPVLRGRIAASGLNAYETYGMTEASSHIALRKIGENDEWFDTLPGISVGLDSRGCLVIDFPGGERIVTNDLATLESSTRFRIDGRYDHVIITGGKKVNPESVERKIAGLINGTYVVTSEPDEKWGSRVVLKIEGESGTGETDELLKGMKNVLDAWEVPKRIIYVERLERTPNGKIKR